MRFPEWVTRPFEARGEQAAGKMSGWRSPLGIFILFGISFAIAFNVAHKFIGIGLSLLPPIALWAEESLETAATLILLLPPFYFLVLRPLERYLAARAEAEEALRASEQLLSRVFDTGADVVYLHTVEPDGHYRFAAVNQAFHTITGLALDQVVGKRVDEVIPQPSLTFVLEKYNAAIREKRIVRWEETSEYPTGRLVGEVSVAPVFNDAGVCTHLVGAVHDVTEHKRSKEALQKSEERYRSTLDNMIEGCQPISFDWRYLYVNDAAAHHGRTTKEKLLGKTMMEAYPGIDETEMFAILRRCMEERLSSHMENEFTYPDGGKGCFELAIQPAPEGIFILSVDVTERKRSEEALRESEARYRSLVDTTSVGVWERRLDGTILYANKAMATILELDSAQQVLDMKAQNFWKDQSRREELLRILRRDGKVPAFEAAWLTSRGNERQVLLSAALNNDTIRGMTVDITELNQAEKEREANLALVRSLVDGMPDALVVANDQGLIIDVNAQTEKMFGYERDEILNKPVELLIPERFKERHMRHRAGYYVRPRLRPMSTVMEMYGRHKDGSEFPIDAMLSPLETPTGLVVLATVRDITEQKQIQAQFLQADRLATVGSTVSGIAHEVTNPLAGALGRAELVLRGNLDDALKADIEVVRSEIWRAALTVRQLLAFAREQKPEKSNISINETLESTLALRQYELTVANVQVVKDLQPDLPTIMADRNQLQQVFLNIILNAEQSMIAAHGRGTLSLSTRQVGDEIVVRIADDGPGILREHLSRVFDPFFTTKPVGKGTGLGLSVSYGIIREHGGTIQVASEVGKGATFTLMLPVTADGQPGS